MTQQARRKIIAPQASQDLRSSEIGDDSDEPTGDEMTPAHRRALDRQEDRKTLISISDRLAGDTLHFRNYKWPGADKEFPESMDAAMRFVTKYYPNTRDKVGLYVDEAVDARSYARALEKKKLLAARKLKYVIICEHFTKADGTTQHPSTFEDCMMQLEGIE